MKTDTPETTREGGEGERKKHRTHHKSKEETEKTKDPDNATLHSYPESKGKRTETKSTQQIQVKRPICTHNKVEADPLINVSASPSAATPSSPCLLVGMREHLCKIDLNAEKKKYETPDAPQQARREERDAGTT